MISACYAIKERERERTVAVFPNRAGVVTPQSSPPPLPPGRDTSAVRFHFCSHISHVPNDTDFTMADGVSVTHCLLGVQRLLGSQKLWGSLRTIREIGLGSRLSDTATFSFCRQSIPAGLCLGLACITSSSVPARFRRSLGGHIGTGKRACVLFLKVPFCCFWGATCDFVTSVARPRGLPRISRFLRPARGQVLLFRAAREFGKTRGF